MCQLYKKISYVHTCDPAITVIFSKIIITETPYFAGKYMAWLDFGHIWNVTFLATLLFSQHF